MRNHDTIAAVATPPGEGGVAIIRVSGPNALAIAARVFRPKGGRAAKETLPNMARYGLFCDVGGEAVDDGLCVTFHAPRSYTGEDTAELSCHGGRATTARVLQLALDAGARLAEPGEFTRRAFLNGRMDLAQAEAVADLIRAQTETSLRQARRQLEGQLSRTIVALKDELIGILASIEVTIDFSEEVGELDYTILESRLQAVYAGVIRLLATAERGRILREGLRVALVGRPNVGKSSLFNALLRADRAIVTPIPGTTRDCLEETANLRGMPLVLLDMAGLRETEDVVERIGVDRAATAAATADVVLFVLDLTAGVTEAERAIAAQISALLPPHSILALNKSDSVSPEQIQLVLQQAQELMPFQALVAVSAQTGAGLESLEEALVTEALGGTDPAALTENVVVANARHRQALDEAHASLEEALRTVENRLPGDFVAIDVRGALDALGQITGETVTEEIIHRIFHDFCVGK